MASSIAAWIVSRKADAGLDKFEAAAAPWPERRGSPNVSIRRIDSRMDPTIKDFESALAELDSIVKTLEEGDLPLEKSLELYERGVQLSRFCHSKLEGAERRIEILNERGEVRPAPANLGLDTDPNRQK
jgi:exodeoxyribonuclease VII small subunit